MWAEAPLRSLRPHRRGGGLLEVAADAGPSVADLIAAARLGGAVGFVVADAATGRVLEAESPDLAQPPASVAKTITSLFALERLGVGHRFVTQLVATGPVVGGRIEGDLVLVGSGDPTLSTDMLGDMAAELAQRGVRGVTGRYLAYAGALPQIAQIDREQPDFVGYNPAISGLNLNFNRVNFEWKRRAKGYDVSMDARAERFVPLVRMARVRVVERDLPVFSYAGGAGATTGRFRPRRWARRAAAGCRCGIRRPMWRRCFRLWRRRRGLICPRRGLWTRCRRAACWCSIAAMPWPRCCATC